MRTSFTLPEAGFYQIQVSLRITDQATVAGDSTGVAVYKNGVSTAQSFSYPEGGGRRSVNLMANRLLAVNDVLTIYAYQLSGVTINAQQLEVSIFRIAG